MQCAFDELDVSGFSAQIRYGGIPVDENQHHAHVPLYNPGTLAHGFLTGSRFCIN